MKLGDMELLDHLVVDAELAFAEGCFDEAKERAAAAIPYIEQALKEEAKKGKRAGETDTSVDYARMLCFAGRHEESMVHFRAVASNNKEPDERTHAINTLRSYGVPAEAQFLQ